MSNLQKLNAQFGIKDQLEFEQNEGGIVFINIDNQYAKARISTYAGQVLSYQPHGEAEDLLFLSDSAVYKYGKAIRGGAPICWPWFGNDRSGFGRPSHGFARNQPWTLLSTGTLDDGSTHIILSLTHTDGSLAIWPHEYQLIIDIIVGKTLTITLTSKNIGKKPFSMTQALHTYFKISEIEDVYVEGLDTVEYLDKVDGFSRQKQTGNVVISKDTDQIYQNAPDQVTLVDPGFDRHIVINSQGSKTTVIWNPWSTAITNIVDLENDSYRKFICIETANAFDDTIILAAGEEHSLTAIYGVNRV